jgi:hypothetical protein
VRRSGQMGCGSLRPQGQNAIDNLSDFLIDRYESFGAQLTERDVQRPLIWPDRAQTVDREIDTFADANTCGPHEEQCLGKQIMGTAKFLLETLIFF